MSVITKTASGLTITKCGDKYIASKGKLSEVYSSLEALTRGITAKSGGKKAKPKKAKKSAGKKKSGHKRPKRYTLAEARAAIGSRAPAKRKTKSKRKSHKLAGHKRGCKCVACSPATRKKAQAARKRGTKRAKRSKPSRSVGRPSSHSEVYHGDVGRFNRPAPRPSYGYSRGYLPPRA